MAAESQNPSFHLSAVFARHQQDVRAVCSGPRDNEVVSGSRDKTVRLWNSITGEESRTLIGHEHFVGSLCLIPPSPHFMEKEFCLASGGNDKIINVWDLEAGSAFLSLIGHEDAVSTLSVVHGLLVSGSWDKKVRVWQGAQCIQTLQGHSLAVWAVLGLEDGTILSGSADKTIKVWKNYQCTATLQRHKDCVRGLADVRGIGFLSCGNDCSILLWSYAGDVLQSLEGHMGFVYSVNVTATGDILSAGEDRALKIWKDGACTQTVIHPGTVWSVASLPNGDVVTGCSDGVARVWSRSKERVASKEAVEAFELSLSSQSLPTDSLGDMQVDKLPGMEALEAPGIGNEGPKLIKNNGKIEAYQWDDSSQRWIKIGDVVDAKSSGGKQVMSGKEYDYIFDVDIGDGQMRKLGYNNSENPFTVAQDFIWREELDQEFLDTVAQFIIQNAQPVTIGQETTYKDPYSANRYQPGGDSTATPMVEKPALPSLVPEKNPVLFESASHAAILKKILEFNAQISDLSLNEQEQDLLSALMDILANTSQTSGLSDAQLSVIQKLLGWPQSQLFPVLDILRLIVLHPQGGKWVLNNIAGIKNVITASYSKASPAANQMLAFRVIGNMFKWDFLHSFLQANRGEFLEQAGVVVKSDNKRQRVTVVTAVLNFSTLYLGKKELEPKFQCMALLGEVLSSEQDEEILFASLLAMGNLIWNDNECAQLVKDIEMNKSIQKLSTSSVDRLRKQAKAILQYTQ